ncbi:hypothetical protein CRM22_010704 [Opisthorchis felineus]|uniref:Uncharacterized protein n=1 Tax=Opisthorchis felineus TaxID=147828 RepID=A0A4S2KQF1_OPIFE|nr:hypothetical protein CRM22_010704 [Opisthorchis felineus]
MGSYGIFVRPIHHGFLYLSISLSNNCRLCVHTNLLVYLKCTQTDCWHMTFNLFLDVLGRLCKRHTLMGLPSSPYYSDFLLQEDAERTDRLLEGGVIGTVQVPESRRTMELYREMGPTTIFLYIVRPVSSIYKRTNLESTRVLFELDRVILLQDELSYPPCQVLSKS